MDAPPPPQNFVNYPRAQIGGSLQEFDALIATNKRVGQAFGIVVIINIVARFAIQANDVTALVVSLAVIIAISAAVAVWAARSYAQTTGKSLGLHTFLGIIAVIIPCMYLIYTAVMQQDLIGRLKNYGLKNRLFGYRKQDVDQIRAALAQQQS